MGASSLNEGADEYRGSKKGYRMNEGSEGRGASEEAMDSQSPVSKRSTQLAEWSVQHLARRAMSRE